MSVCHRLRGNGPLPGRQRYPRSTELYLPSLMHSPTFLEPNTSTLRRPYNNMVSLGYSARGLLISTLWHVPVRDRNSASRECARCGESTCNGEVTRGILTEAVSDHRVNLDVAISGSFMEWYIVWAKTASSPNGAPPLRLSCRNRTFRYRWQDFGKALLITYSCGDGVEVGITPTFA